MYFYKTKRYVAKELERTLPEHRYWCASKVTAVDPDSPEVLHACKVELLEWNGCYQVTVKEARPVLRTVNRRDELERQLTVPTATSLGRPDARTPTAQAARRAEYETTLPVQYRDIRD